MGLVVDHSRWPVVTASVEKPSDLEELAGGLELILADERPFGLSILAPQNLETLNEMLWEAPEARRRLRRQRSRMAAWCEATAHVLDEDALARTMPSDLRYAELVWGCATVAAGSEEDAAEKLLGLLAERPESLPMQAV